MKLFKQSDSSISAFNFVEIAVCECKVVIVTCSANGKKIEKTKEYKDNRKAIIAAEKYAAKQVSDGYFECDGDQDGPILKSPLGLGDAPDNFNERLDQLKACGIILYAVHSHSYELDRCSPLDQFFVANKKITNNPLLLLSANILSSKELQETLSWYAGYGQEYTSKDEWESDFEDTISTFSKWKTLTTDSALVGAYVLRTGVSDADIGVISSKLVDPPCEGEEVFKLTSDTYSELGFFLEDESVSKTLLGLLCLQSTAKLLTEIRAWLYKGYKITTYELTTSTLYVSIQKPLALRVYIAQNEKNGDIYSYFFHMQYD